MFTPVEGADWTLMAAKGDQVRVQQVQPVLQEHRRLEPPVPQEPPGQQGHGYQGIQVYGSNRSHRFYWSHRWTRDAAGATGATGATGSTGVR